MFLRLRYAGGWSPSGMLNDLLSVFNGETDKNNLTNTTLDVANSEIINTVAIGWTVWDNQVGSGYFVVRAPISDDNTKFKYVKIFTDATYVRALLYTDWDNSTHVGTNPAETGAAAGGYINNEAAQVSNVEIYISLDANYICAGSTISNLANAGSCVLISEFTRDSNWDTVANGFPPVFQSNAARSWPYYAVLYPYSGGGSLYNLAGRLPLTMNPSTGADATRMPTVLTCELGSMYNDYTAGYTNDGPVYRALSTSTKAYPGGPDVTPKVPLAIVSPSYAHAGGSLTAKSGVWLLGSNQGALGDTVQLDGIDYLIFRQHSVFCLLMPIR